jgi:hypothetical protein
MDYRYDDGRFASSGHIVKKFEARFSTQLHILLSSGVESLQVAVS